MALRLIASRGFQVYKTVGKPALTRALSTYFTKSHEYINVKGNVGTVGITNVAADALGDVVFVELPSVGKTYSAGDSFGSVESVKAASDVYSPVAGEIVEANNELESTPGLVNESPFEKGWFMKIQISAQGQNDLKTLLTKEQYETFVKESHH